MHIETIGDYQITFEKIKEAIDSLGKPPKEFFGLPLQFKESNVFPFEITYKACDLQTKEEINIKSGELIHGAIVDSKGYVSAYFIHRLSTLPSQENNSYGKV